MFLQIPDITPVLTDSVPTIAEQKEMLKSLPFDVFVQKAVNSMVTFAINLAIAIVVFYIGRLVINKLYTFITTICLKRKLDQSLTTFVLSLVKIVLYFILIVTVIGIIGIETSSFIAIFASAGVAIGMALSGTLQNFAGGVLILLLKPYKIGDYIETQGYAGTVREIQIFHTIITTGDNKSIIIPNGGLSTGSINNWSKEDYRRVDWTVGISYGDNVDNARSAILAMLNADSRIVKNFIEDDREERAELIKHKLEEQQEGSENDSEAEIKEEKRGFFARIMHKPKLPHPHIEELPKPSALFQERADRSPRVWVAELADSSVNLKITAWTPTSSYWSVFYDLNEKFYNELPKAGINFPFPQLDVHVNPNSNT